MYKERQYWLAEYKSQEARETDGSTAFVQFERPT
jgi:hypothetical protein